MIRSVKLRNWKSHEHSDLHFASGANVLVGPMGAGKTSVVDAICFALFGTFPALKSRKITLSQVVMSRPQAKQTATVELEFEAPDGKVYTAQRIVTAKQTKAGEDRTEAEAYLRLDGKLLDGPQPVRTNESIQRVLGVDYELFVRAAYAEQNKVDALLALSPKERKKQFDELLGIDRFETARGNAVSLGNKYKAMKQAAVEALGAIRVDELKTQLADVHAQLAALEGQEKKDADAVAHAQKALVDARTHADKLTILEKAALAAEQNAASALSVVESLEKQTASLPPATAESVAAAKTHVEHARLAVGEKQKHADELLAHVAGVDAQLKTGEVQAKTRNVVEAEIQHATQSLHALTKGNALETLETHAVQAREHLTHAQTALAGEKAQVEQCTTSLAALSHKGANCPVCERPLEDGAHEHLTNQKKTLLAKLHANVQTATRDVATAIAQLQVAERTLGDAKRVQDQLNSATKRLEQLPAPPDAARLKAEREALHAKRTQALADVASTRQTLDAALSKAQGLTDAANVLARLEKAKHELATKQQAASHARAQVKPGELDAARENVITAAQVFERAHANRHATRTRIIDKQAQLAPLERSLQQTADAHERAARLGEQSESLSIFATALLETQEDLRTQLVGAINEAMALLWPAVYPYRDYAALRITPTESDYALELQTPLKTWANADAVSGGERSCAALTLRMALAWVLAPNLHWLFLDEPTHNLDRTAVDRLSRSLREEIPKLVGQVFLITHDDALKEGAGGALFKFERDKDKGDVTQVEKVLETNE